MDAAAFAALLTPAGQAALAAAADLRPTLTTYPACADRLTKQWPAAVARAALDVTLLRRKAAGKFERAERLYFTRDGYEMASGTAAARHRAARFRGYGRVADLTCGVGGDAIELAAVADVVAFDTSELHADMTAANLAAVGRAGTVHAADALAAPLDVTAAFADPGRRAGGTRTVGVESADPPLSVIRARFPIDFPLAVKLAPGVPRADLIALDAEAEFVSFGGELKECVVWFGPLQTATARATLLPVGATLTGDPDDRPRVGPVGRYVYDPDPAVTRSGLVAELASSLGATAFDPAVAFLTADAPTPTPFASIYEVEAVLPYQPRKVGEWLRARGVGRVTPIKRGSDADVNALVAGWKLGGDGHRVVLLTRVAGAAAAVMCQEPG